MSDEPMRMTVGQIMAALKAIELKYATDPEKRATFEAERLTARNGDDRAKLEGLIKRHLSADEFNSLSVEEPQFDVNDVKVVTTLSPEEERKKKNEGYKVVDRWRTRPVGEPISGREGFQRVREQIVAQIRNMDYPKEHIDAFEKAFNKCLDEDRLWDVGWCKVREPGPVWEQTRGGQRSKNARKVLYKPNPDQHGLALCTFVPEVAMVVCYGERCGGNPIVEEQSVTPLLRVDVEGPTCQITSTKSPAHFTSPEEVISFEMKSQDASLRGNWFLNSNRLTADASRIELSGREMGDKLKATLKYEGFSKLVSPSSGQPYKATCEVPVTSEVKQTPAVVVGKPECRSLRASRGLMGPKDTVEFSAEIVDLPKDTTVNWYVNDFPRPGGRDSFKLVPEMVVGFRSSSQREIRVTYRATNSDGKTIAECSKGILLDPLPVITKDTPKNKKGCKKCLLLLAAGVIPLFFLGGDKKGEKSGVINPGGTPDPRPTSGGMTFSWGGRR
jgi:hypothetical protein